MGYGEQTLKPRPRESGRIKMSAAQGQITVNANTNESTIAKPIFPLHDDFPTHLSKRGLIPFGEPSTEIGKIISFSSNLPKDYRRYPWVRAFVGGLVAVAAFFGAHYLLTGLMESQDITWTIAATVVAGLAFLMVFFNSETHVCNFIGPQGIVHFTCRNGNPTKLCSTKIVRFDEAVTLTTKATRKYLNNQYTGTDYEYTWYAENHRVLASFDSSKSNLAEEPFLKAAEKLWNQHLMEKLTDQTDGDGFVSFPVVGLNMNIRVGTNCIEFEHGGKRERWEANKIGGMKMEKGQMMIWHKQAVVNWRTREGVFEFEYSDLGTARLFLALANANLNLIL